MSIFLTSIRVVNYYYYCIVNSDGKVRNKKIYNTCTHRENYAEKIEIFGLEMIRPRHIQNYAPRGWRWFRCIVHSNGEQRVGEDAKTAPRSNTIHTQLFASVGTTDRSAVKSRRFSRIFHIFLRSVRSIDDPRQKDNIILLLLYI